MIDLIVKGESFEAALVILRREATPVVILRREAPKGSLSIQGFYGRGAKAILSLASLAQDDVLGATIPCALVTSLFTSHPLFTYVCATRARRDTRSLTERGDEHEEDLSAS